MARGGKDMKGKSGRETPERKEFQKGSRMMGTFELADLFGVTTEALRKYESKGILQPYRSENGYRKYSSWELTKIIRVRQLRQAGLSLDSIGDELEMGNLGLRLQNMEGLREELTREIAYREKLIRWTDAQKEEMLRMEALGDGCDIERKGRQYCCVYMVQDTLVNKTGAEWEHLKEWIQALPFAKVYYMSGLQEETLSCLALEEEELERYDLQHLVPDFVVPERSYVVCNTTQEYKIKTELEDESKVLARQKAEQMGLALADQAILQMVWYTYRKGVFHSHNKGMIPIVK